jgi:AcrR family transcriptional regulator
LKSSVGANTKTHILDIAERHFAVYGFAGTSLRAIIKEAKVNVAAVAYHFGNKEELYSAVMERFAVPVVEQQLEKLRLKMQKENVQLEEVLKAFYEPPIKLVKGLGSKGNMLSLFLGRAQTEPEPIFSLVDRHYAACRNEFIQAMRKLITDLPESEYQWRFEFMLSLIVCFLTRQEPIRRRFSNEDEWEADEVVERLITFCGAGMKARK